MATESAWHSARKTVRVDSSPRISTTASTIRGLSTLGRLELVAKFCTYAEITPSGRGLRIWIRAKKPGNRCKAPSHKDKFLATVELYEHSRYLTVTGRILEGVPAAIATRQAALNELYGAMFGGAGNHQGNGQPQAQSPVDVSDEALLEKARKAKNGAAFSALFDQGDTSRNGRDDSSADLALLNRLAFWTGCDSSRMETLFSASALGKREKWKERPDYRARSIDRAIADCTATYEPRPKSGAKPSSNGTGHQAAPLRPEITITTREHEVTDQAVAAIAADGNLFQRGGNLVAILEDCRPQPKQTGIKRPPGSLRISLLPHAQIRRLMTVHADWLKSKVVRGKQEIVRAHPPTWAVEAVATFGAWKGIRPLEGIVEAPTLRPDGSLINQPGYDPDTGLWFVPSGVFPPIPDNRRSYRPRAPWTPYWRS